MARKLKKFVNPQFTATVPLVPLRRLIERHPAALKQIDIALFESDPSSARAAVLDYLKGPEEALPDDLIADLHAIAELGTRQGLELLLQQYRRANIPFTASRADAQEPKHVALIALLESPEVFEAAANLLSLYQTTGIAEFVGPEEGMDAQIDAQTLRAFKRAARVTFEADLRGDYCEVEWYEDGPEIVLVVSHGAPVTTTTVVEKQMGRPAAFRTIDLALVSYSAAGGRLKLAGISKAKRGEIAEAFASCLLGRPGFFRGRDAQNLYTLAPLERDWPEPRITHAFDRHIRRVQIVEAQVDRVSCDLFGEFDRVEWSLVARDSKDCALARLREAHSDIEFSSGNWRIGHIVLRVRIDVGRKEPASVTVKVKPHAAATFRRNRFEPQIMELLRRNGFCRDRDADRTAVAAE